jgi:hypothetical protein
LAAEAISAARQAGCTGQIVFRIDSALYSAAVPGAIRRGGARFSVTVRMDPKIRAAIAAIGQDTDHLPEGWHRETGWMNLFQAACGPPDTAA